MSVAGNRSCGLRTDGTIDCWGDDRRRPKQPDPPPPPPGHGCQELLYTVKDGDTLFNIAKTHNVSLDDLVEYNNITNPDVLYSGDTLCIPE